LTNIRLIDSDKDKNEKLLELTNFAINQPSQKEGNQAYQLINQNLKDQKKLAIGIQSPNS
jgi:hypothetical protein